MANDVSYDYRDYTATGEKAELDFIKAVKAKNIDVVVVKATEEQDMFQHWDYSFDGVTIDIKSRRNIGILNANGDKYTVLELVNRNGDKGWLFGDAQYIAFEFTTNVLDAFLVIPRIELVKYHEAHTQDIIVNDMNDCIHKKYSNTICEFVLTGVPLEEIQKLSGTKLIKKANDTV